MRRNRKNLDLLHFLALLLLDVSKALRRLFNRLGGLHHLVLGDQLRLLQRVQPLLPLQLLGQLSDPDDRLPDRLRHVQQLLLGGNLLLALRVLHRHHLPEQDLQLAAQFQKHDTCLSNSWNWLPSFDPSLSVACLAFSFSAAKAAALIKKGDVGE